MSENLNPLLSLPQEKKEDVFYWLRDGADYESITSRFKENKIPLATKSQVEEFFTAYARERWTRRIDRAAAVVENQYGPSNPGRAVRERKHGAEERRPRPPARC